MPALTALPTDRRQDFGSSLPHARISLRVCDVYRHTTFGTYSVRIGCTHQYRGQTSHHGTDERERRPMINLLEPVGDTASRQARPSFIADCSRSSLGRWSLRLAITLMILIPSSAEQNTSHDKPRDPELNRVSWGGGKKNLGMRVMSPNFWALGALRLHSLTRACLRP